MRWRFLGRTIFAALVIWSGGSTAATAQDCATLDPVGMVYVTRVGSTPADLRTIEAAVPAASRLGLLTIDQGTTLAIVGTRVEFPAVVAGTVVSATLVLDQTASPTCIADEALGVSGYACTDADRAANPLRLSVNGGAVATTPFVGAGRQVVELALPTADVSSDGTNVIAVSMAEREYSTGANKSIFQLGAYPKLRVCTSLAVDPVEALAAQFGVDVQLLRALMAILEAQR